MLKRTSWQFDLRVIDEMDRPEYQEMARILSAILGETGETVVSIESVKTDLMMLTIEQVEVA